MLQLSSRFKVRRQHSLLTTRLRVETSLESQASELQTYRRKIEFNAKWPFKVIQGHVFWSKWKGENQGHVTGF